MSDFSYLVGSRVRTLRKQRKLTQEQLAEKATLHYSYLSSLERGERNISLESLEKVIVALEITPMQILNFSDTEVLEERADKVTTIEAISGLLQGRDNEEVKMIYRVLKDMLETFDNKNSKNST